MMESIAIPATVESFFQTEVARQVQEIRTQIATHEYIPDIYTCKDYSTDLVKELQRILDRSKYSVGMIVIGRTLDEMTNISESATKDGITYDNGHGMVIVTTYDNSKGIVFEPQSAAYDWAVEDPMQGTQLFNALQEHLKRSIDYPPEYNFDSMRFGILFPIME